MNILQATYNFFKNLKTPDWLKELLAKLEPIIIEIITQLGKEALSYLESRIVEASRKDWTDTQKREYVYRSFRESFNMGYIKDHAIWFAIELCVTRLKKQGII